MSSHSEASQCGTTPSPEAGHGGPRAAEAPDEVLELRHISQLKGMRLPGKPSLFVELTSIFRKEAPARMERLAVAVSDRNHEEVGRLAHAMVGSLATLGARRMQKAARHLEQAASEADWSTIPARHSHILECWSQLEAAFDQHIKEECS